MFNVCNLKSSRHQESTSTFDCTGDSAQLVIVKLNILGKISMLLVNKAGISHCLSGLAMAEQRQHTCNAIVSTHMSWPWNVYGTVGIKACHVCQHLERAIIAGEVADHPLIFICYLTAELVAWTTSQNTSDHHWQDHDHNNSQSGLTARWAIIAQAYTACQSSYACCRVSRASKQHTWQ